MERESPVPRLSSPAIRPLDHLALTGRDHDPALLLRDRVMTYEDLRARIAAISGWLIARLPEKGARVATWAAKGELTCLIPLAAARAGLVHVPINPLLKRAQVAHILADSGAALLIGSPARLATLEADDITQGCQVLDEDAALAEVATHGNSLGPSAADPDA
ncbi:MAG TPA: AMP-binding protein, partial [Novosphingobium sp.]|nr:AMP-binding protein [Novosphingobium sp.]